MTCAIAELNQMSQDDFVNVLGAVFEETPDIARQAWHRRPFSELAELHQCMVDVVSSFGIAEQLALIRAHPDLGSTAKMADASIKEQAEVGLDRLSPDEFRQVRQLNQQYKDTFGFPFIIAVKNQTTSGILDAFAERLPNSVVDERQRAIAEIGQIAWFRLQEVVRG